MMTVALQPRRSSQETKTPCPRVPDGQALTPVRDAFQTAKSLGGPLWTATEAIGDVGELAKAKEGGYILAVDPKDLPRTEGWYIITRKDGKVTYEFIKPKRGEDIPEKIGMLLSKGRYNEVLYITERAIKAAEKGGAVALSIDYYCYGRIRRRLYINDRPNVGARVGLSGKAREAGALLGEITADMESLKTGLSALQEKVTALQNALRDTKQ